MNTPVRHPRDYVVLRSAEHFCTFGFWRPGMREVHARLLSLMNEYCVRFWASPHHEVRVHPEDLAKANALALTCVAEP